MYGFARFSRGQKATGFWIPAARDRLLARDLAVGCGIARREIRSRRLSNRSCQNACQRPSASRCGSIFRRLVPQREAITACTFGRRELAICRVVCRPAMQTQGNRTVWKIFRRYYQFRLMIGLDRKISYKGAVRRKNKCNYPNPSQEWLGAFFSADYYRKITNDLFSNSALIYVTGFITVIIGLLIVTYHNRWAKS
jgi:hypothetical protein